MSDNVRNLGYEADIDVVQAITPIAYTTSSTPIVSAAIDRGAHARKRVLVLASCKADATSTGVTPLVTESATSGGAYTTATTNGTWVATNAASEQFVSVQFNAAKPWIKVTMTPAGGSGVVAASVVFLSDRT